RSPNRWNEEKRLLLSRANLFLRPSIREGYGIVVIAANACGTPAIGWSAPGVPDSIIAGKTGSLVPFDDTVALADTIVKLLMGNPQRLAELSRAAIAW